MFPSYLFARTLIAAAIVTALMAGLMHPVMAANADFVAVPTEKLGNAAALDDSARPTADTPLHVTFALNSAQIANIDSYVSSLTNPLSPNYHKWLTPQQFGEKFGASSSDIASVKQYLANNNFSNVKVYSNNLFVTADVDRATAESTFGVTIHGYDRSADLIAKGLSPTYYAPDTQPVVPAALASKLHGIFGLSNANAKVSQLHKFFPPVQVPGGSAAFTPQQLATQYGMSILEAKPYYDKGNGMTIGIYSPTAYLPSDITAFFTAQNITPEPTINVISVDGGITDQTNSGEACLDIETIGGQANEATIDVYEGPNDGSLNIFNRIAEDNAIQILSMSWGSFEVGGGITAAFAQSYDVVRSEMSSEGITMFVASGDTGAYNAATGGVPSVTVDASSQYVTAVGGTQLGGTGTGEQAWTYVAGNDGSNGGLSIFYPRPYWQAGYGVYQAGTSNGMRQVPDVASLAGLPGVQTFNNGVASVVGGTSVAAPTWSVGMLLVEEQLGGNRLGNINPALYGYAETASTSYNDIIAGNNGVYDAGPGWDFVTGWGSPVFNNLLTDFEGGTTVTTVPPVVTTTTQTFPPGLQMITIPYSYAGTYLDAPQLLDGLVNSSGQASFEVAAWDPFGQAYDVTPTTPANVPTLGQAYWARFGTKFGGVLTVNGTPTNALAYGVPISQGWNMIGDPFINTSPISIDTGLQINYGNASKLFPAAASAGWVDPTIYGYDQATNSYTSLSASTGVLEPWTGYWLYSGVNGELTFFAP